MIFQLSNRFNALKEITENFDFLQPITLIDISEVKNIEQLTSYILKHDYSTSYCDILRQL